MYDIIHQVAICALIFVHDAESFADGGSPATCIEAGNPHHHTDPQLSPSPYSVILNKYNVTSRETIKITLRSDTADAFKGFMVMATWASGNQEELPGQFVNIPEDVARGIPWYYHLHVPTCVTHVNPEPKMEVNLTWIAPDVLYSDVIIRASFVMKYDIYWSNVETPLLQAVVRRPEEDKDNTRAAGEDFHEINFGDECGVTKGCFLYPDGCHGNGCYVAASWEYIEENNEVVMEIFGNHHDYVVLGLSTDKTMGDDETVHCVVSGGYTGLHYGYSPALYNHRHRMVNFTGIEVQRLDDRVQCRFRRSLHTSLIPYLGSPVRHFDLNVPMYLQLAWGSMYTGTTVTHRHVHLPVVTHSKVDFRSRRVHGGRVLPLSVAVHSFLGVIAYLTLTSTAVLLARHFREDMSRPVLGPPLWLQLHRAIVILASLLAAILLIVIFTYFRRWTKVAQTHALLGLVATGVMLVQLTFGFLRPAPGSHLRPLFNWTHRMGAVTAYTLSVACIFLGLKTPYIEESVHDTLTIIMAVWVALPFTWHILVQLYEAAKKDFFIPQKKSENGTSPPAESQMTIEPDTTRNTTNITFKRFMLIVLCVAHLLLVLTTGYFLFTY